MGLSITFFTILVQLVSQSASFLSHWWSLGTNDLYCKTNTWFYEFQRHWKESNEWRVNTFIAEVSAIINLRPLVPVLTDPENPLILTLAMLFTQKTNTLLLQISFENSINRRYASRMETCSCSDQFVLFQKVHAVTTTTTKISLTLP